MKIILFSKTDVRGSSLLQYSKICLVSVQVYKYIYMYMIFQSKTSKPYKHFSGREDIYGKVSSFQTLFPIINLLQPVIISECLDMHVCILCIIIMGTDIIMMCACVYI